MRFAFWAAFLSTALMISVSGASAQSLDAIYARLLSNPDNYELNMAYGQAAESAPHSMRHAYAAYERAYLANPGDPKALEALRRVRARLLPNVTTVTVTSGVSYVSNPREAPAGVTNKALGIARDGAGDIGAIVTNDRSLLGMRWRSSFQVYAQGQLYASNVNLLYASAYSGPVFYLGYNWTLHVAPLVATAALGGQQLFTDYGGLATVSTVFGGQPQSVNVRAVYRDTYSNPSAEPNVYSNGSLVDLEGRFQMRPRLTDADTLYIAPLVRFSTPYGPGPTAIDPAAAYNDPLFVGNYTQTGVRISYFWPVAGPDVILGAGFGYHHRWYEQNVAFGTSQRSDDYFEPTFHVIFPALFAPNVDLRFDYRFEHNESNDPLERFDNHVVGFHVVGRF